MSAFLDILGSVGLWEAVLRIATPLIFGTLGVVTGEGAQYGSLTTPSAGVTCRTCALACACGCVP